MPRKLILWVYLVIPFWGVAQYKNDNVLFSTVDPSELCAVLAKNKGYILLDVRSKGEHYDTSSSPGYNFGHLKGAKNIDIRELGSRISEIREYKDQPVFVYCSHSQRSRRAGKMLADSGFTKVFNINGGMTAIHSSNERDKDCLRSLVEMQKNYDIISPADLCTKIMNNKDLFILDVRKDSAFRHISLDAKSNAMGNIRNSVNIPYAELKDRMGELPGPGSEIVITDIYGDEAARAALLLAQNGYTRTSVLIEGIDKMMYADDWDLPCKKQIYQSPVAYQLLNIKDFGRALSEKRPYLLVDIRTNEEFINTHKDSWRNIGHISGAMNIPSQDIESRIKELEKYKDKEVLVYGFSNGPEVYAAAHSLQKNGFRKVRLLVGGIFNVRWTAANIKGQSHLRDYVVNIPEVNW